MRSIRVLIGFTEFASIATGCILTAKFGFRNSAWANDRIGSKLAQVLTRLSGVYVKFGQILAMRPDILPGEITRHLDELFDRVEPEPLETSLHTIRSELDVERSSRIVRIDDPALAGASFATVYRGRLDNGDRVAIKVQRSGIDKLVHRDIRVLLLVARIVDATGIFEAILAN